MANIKAKIRKNPNKIVAQTLKIGNVALTDLTDINAAGTSDGAVLIYNGTSSQWDTTTVVGNSNTNITGGTY
tara:strand:+ start:567 stop:782 length:216 start_codon:yes stop_codon:yes gene_type:complete